MKRLLFFLAVIFITTSCVEPTKKKSSKIFNEPFQSMELPTLVIDKSMLEYKNEVSIWTLEGEAFSGTAVTYYPDGSLSQKFGIFKGKMQNEAIHWFTDGHYKRVANYHKGKLHGEKKSWTQDANHVLVSHLNYHSGKAHGIQKKWYSTGEIFKILQLEMGKEKGIQQAFRKNGDLFANYEARDGRTYGLRKAALCYGLDDEEIQWTK